MRSIVKTSLAIALTLLASCMATDDAADPDAVERRPPPPPKVKVCHLPPGNPSAAHTIEVSQSAVPAHLAHGDTVGQCVCPPGEVWVCYTGPSDTDMVGNCDRGVKTCAADGLS